MNDRSWRIVAVILAVILAVLGGATIAFVLAPGPGATPSPGGSFALGSPSSPTGASPSSSASISATPSAPTTSASPSPSVSPAPSPAPIAQFTITELKLDPKVPPSAGLPLFVTFISDGPGTFTAQLKAISPQGTTHMCLRAGSKDVKCADAASGTMTANTTSSHVTWRVSLEGTGTFTPTVELTVTFAAAKPSVKITHAHFDGTGSPDTNGIQVLFTPRAAGKARVVADWGHSYKYEIDAINQASGTGGTTLANQGPATKTDKSVPVTAGETWKILLENTSNHTGTVDMIVTISWP